MLFETEKTTVSLTPDNGKQTPVEERCLPFSPQSVMMPGLFHDVLSRRALTKKANTLYFAAGLPIIRAFPRY
ncbi:hypothetical protein [Marinobacter segnicrescens]|uniref:hypothetical protein n=1 Tax=Marinobacter segnicrescens TaxID=430453 RepID=UPI003A90A76F